MSFSINTSHYSSPVPMHGDRLLVLVLFYVEDRKPHSCRTGLLLIKPSCSACLEKSVLCLHWKNIFFVSYRILG